MLHLCGKPAQHSAPCHNGQSTDLICHLPMLQVFVKDPRLCASVWSHLPASAKHALLAAGPKMATTSLRNMITHWSTMQPPHGPHATQVGARRDTAQCLAHRNCLQHAERTPAQPLHCH